MNQGRENTMVNPKPELQDVIGKILSKHRIDMFGHYKYDLKLRMPDHLIIKDADSYASVGHYYEPDGDLVLFVKKLNRYMRIGLYYEQNGIDFCDPVIAFDSINRIWHPVRIERVHGEMNLSYAVSGGRVMIPDKIEDFSSFERKFAQYIKEQGWLKKGVRIKRK